MVGPRRSGPPARSSAVELHRAGVALVLGGLLWQPMLAFQNLADLHHRSAAWPWALDQVGFLVAMTFLLVGLVALDRARVTGDGRPGRWAMHVLVVAWGALTLAQLVTLTLEVETPEVGMVSGLLTYPAAVVAGTSVVRGGRWTGWRRWTLLGEGVYETLVILVPLLVLDWGPSWATEAGWQLCWVLVGAAALTESRAVPRVPPGAPYGAPMMRP